MHHKRYIDIRKGFQMRDLTSEERDDARRLKQLWIAKKDALHLSQVKAAKELGYNSQGAISQYINGKVSLNFQAAAKFAKLLRVEIKDISPRFAPLVGKPVPTSLDGYTAPVTGILGGMQTNTVLDWFAYSDRFANQVGVPVDHIKLVRVDDSSFKEFPAGTVFLVDDREQKVASDGVYLLQEGDAIIGRRVTIEQDGVVLSSGAGKKQRLSKDVFGLLRIVGRVISVFSPVA